MANLDNALEALQEAQTGKLMDFPEFMAELLNDHSLFATYAIKYMKEAGPGIYGFIKWSFQRYLAENSPAHKTAWQDENKPQEYDPGESYQESLKRRFGGGK